MQIYFLPRNSNLEIRQLSASQTPCFESAQKKFFFKQSFFRVHIFVLLDVSMAILLCLSRAKTNYSASFLMSPVSAPAPQPGLDSGASSRTPWPPRPWAGHRTRGRPTGRRAAEGLLALGEKEEQEQPLSAVAPIAFLMWCLRRRQPWGRCGHTGHSAETPAVPDDVAETLTDPTGRDLYTFSQCLCTCYVQTQPS